MTADQRILQAVSGRLQVTLVDSNGSPAAASGTVTVGVTRANGTELLAAGTATTTTTTGVYEVALTAAQTALLDVLTATWIDDGDGSTNTTTHEIVGGFYFSIAEARASDPSLIDTGKYPDALILATRQEVEEECEYICDVAFVPRYAREVLDGGGLTELLLAENMLRTVRTVRVYSSPTAYTSFTADELAALSLDADHRIVRTDRNVFFEGLRNVVVEYEHGYNRPPSDLKRATLTRLRHRLNASRSGVPDRAVSFTSTEAGTFRLDTPDRYKTGIPEVDAVYMRHSRRSGDGPNDQIPAYGSIDFNPTRDALFHGGFR